MSIIVSGVPHLNLVWSETALESGSGRDFALYSSSGRVNGLGLYRVSSYLRRARTVLEQLSVQKRIVFLTSLQSKHHKGEQGSIIVKAKRA